MSDDQYLRQAKLVVADDSGNGIDLSPARIVFRSRKMTVQTLGTLVARIYNLGENGTIKQIQDEFTLIQLDVAYGGPDDNPEFGTIFRGQIRLIRRGRESPVDSYLDLYCADADEAYQFATVIKPLPGGITEMDRVNAVIDSFAPFGITAGKSVTDGDVPAILGKIKYPRACPTYDLARDVMREVCESTRTTWFLEDGKFQMRPLTSYLQAPPIALSARTGMIGRPEQMQDGIHVRCLMNPQIKIGTRIKIDNASINQATRLTVPGSAPVPSPSGPVPPFDQWTGIDFLPSIAEDGIYMVALAEHRGDTRGNDWYTDMVALKVDETSPALTSVSLAGSNE